MITNLRPYAATRDSSVPWIGAVPKHWQIRRLGSLLRERGETNSDGQENRVLSVLSGTGVIPYAEKGNVGNKKSEDITRYKIVKLNDIVVNSMNVIIGSVGLSRYLGCLSPVYYVLTRRSVYDNPRYLDALFQVTPFQKSLVRIGSGILAHRMRIPMTLLKCENFPYPPHDEQTAIVCFLDHIDQKIQRLISAKQKLATLLEEQKIAMIHHTVTRGLDSTVRLVHSGAEWIGNVPEHWKIARLKSLMGNVVERAHERGSTDLYVAMEHVESWTGRLVHADFDAVFESQVKRFRSGDILFGKLRPYLAKVTRPAQSGVCVGEFLVLRHIHSNIDPKYMEWLLRSKPIIDEINRSTVGAKMPRVDWSFMGRLVVAVPPLSEQSDIAAFLDRTAADLDAAVISVRREVSLLREYRTRLISDVVTGKLDVREAADNVEVGLDASNRLDGSADFVDECQHHHQCRGG